jgi:Beta-ketoacyl synthase, N-terminal domain
MTSAWVLGLGVLGPGLDGWERTCSVLQRKQPYVREPTQIPIPDILPARDRRRCSDTVRLALHVAAATVRAARLDSASLPSVFANSAGDGQVVHRLLAALATPEKLVSPTDFHNSVHNAPAFYWSLGVGSRAASTSIAAAQFTFAAALIKSVAQSTSEGGPVLAVCFDHPLPSPLHETYPIVAPLGVGLALTSRYTGEALARLDLSWEVSPSTSRRVQPPELSELVDLWSGNPAGRALPLLEVIANRREAALCLPASTESALRVNVTCH